MNDPADTDASSPVGIGTNGPIGIDARDPIGVEEKAYRRAVLHDLERRVEVTGAHVARDSPERARQFMPFAALKGYGELMRDKERMRIPRPELFDERLAEISSLAARLEKGDDVRIIFYTHGQRHALQGPFSFIDETMREIVIRDTRIPLGNVIDIERSRGE